MGFHPYKVEDSKLSCGSKLYFMYRPGGLVSVRAIVNAGSIDEAANEHGVAHYLEHMFFRGSETKSAKQISMELAKLGYFNAYTYYDRTAYFVNCISEDWANALLLMNEMLTGATLPEQEFEKERNVILEEIQTGMDEPNDYFWSEVDQHLWGAAHRIAGTCESVSGMTREQLLSYKERTYTPENISFAVVGDVAGAADFDELAHLVNAILGAKPEQSGFTRLRPQQQFSKKPHRLEHAAQQAYLAFCLPALPRAERDKKNWVNLLYLSCLGGGMHSLLWQKLRDQSALCYAVGAFENGYSANHVTTLYSMLSPENIDLAIGKMAEVLADIKRDGIPDDLIEVSRKNLLYAERSSRESVNLLAARYFDNCFIGYPDPDSEGRGLRRVTKQELLEYADFVNSTEPTIITMNNVIK